MPLPLSRLLQIILDHFLGDGGLLNNNFVISLHLEISASVLTGTGS